MRRSLLLASALTCVAASPAQHEAEWAGTPPWVTQANGIPAAVDLNFVQNIYQPANALGLIAVTRASPVEASGPDGTWFAFPSGQLPVTASGALIEEARTNSIRNNTMQGAVAGTPGTQPNNWSQTFVTNAGLTSTIVALPTASGLACIDEQVSGTSSGTSGVLDFETTVGISFAQGQTWADSLLLQIVGGGLTNISSVQMGFGATLALTQTIVPTTTMARYVFPVTLTGAQTGGRAGIILNFSNGVAINITLRVCAPQLENNSNINSTVASATVNAGGSLYTPSSSGTVTWSGSGCTTNPVLNVTTNSGGAVSGVTSVATAGSCTTFPSSSATTWTDGTGLGTGSGASFNLVPTNLAANACATSPILTTSAAATRAGTVATQVLPAGATSTSGYSLLGIGTPECPTGYPVQQYLLQADDGTASNLIALLRQSSNGAYGLVEVVSGSSVNPTPSGTWAQATTAKMAGYASAAALTAVANNGTAVTSARVGPAPTTTLRIGTNRVGASLFNGTIARLVVAPASLLNN